MSRNDIPQVSDAEPTQISPSLAVEGKNSVVRGTRGRALNDIINSIEIDETIHLPARGSWSTPHLIQHLLNFIGPAECWVTSWSVKEQAVRILIDLIDKKQITQLHCLFDERIRVQCPQAYQLASNNFVDMRLTKIHAKVVVLRNADWGITIATSANLTRNPRIENFVISTHRQVADFYLEWIQEEIENSNPFEL